MDPFLFKLLALAVVVFFVGKRAVVGPQKTFARLSVTMVVAGFVILQLATQYDDFAANVGAALMLLGMLVAVFMVSVDCIHMLRVLFASRKI